MTETRFSHIHTVLVPNPGRLTRRYEVRTNDAAEHLLGRVRWRSGWRCYVFEPCFPTVFEHDCLRDIAGFIEALTAEQRAAK